MTQAGPTVVSTALAIDMAGSLVLGRRARQPWRGGWLTPGGKVNTGESMEAAVRREFVEETGLDIILAGYVGDAGVYDLKDPSGGSWVVVYSHAFVCGGELMVGVGTDVDRVGMFTRRAVQGLADHHRIVGASDRALRRNGWIAS